MTEHEHAALVARLRSLRTTHGVHDSAADALDAQAATIEALRARVAELEKGLRAIADCRDMTLLGGTPRELVETAPHRDPTAELAHEVGAHKAFNQCASMAAETLKDTQS